jgi:hypothetical protein
MINNNVINWAELLIGFGFSILGSAIVMIVAYVWKFRYLIEKSNFQNQKSAEKRIIKDIEKASDLKVYAMCGSSFSDITESKIAQKIIVDKQLTQKYLISSKDNVENIQKRQEELPQKKGDKPLQEKIEKSIKDFEGIINIDTTKRTIQYHKEKVGFRLIIFNHCLYLSHQAKNKYGRDTKIQRIDANTPAYINFLEYFDGLWENHS